MRRRWVYVENKETKQVEAVEVGQDWEPTNAKSTGDLGKFEYTNLRAPDGTDISSRSLHARYMKRQGLAMAGDFAETLKAQRVAQAQAERRERRDAVGRALYQSRTRRRR